MKKTRIIAILAVASMALTACGAGKDAIKIESTEKSVDTITVSDADMLTCILSAAGETQFDSGRDSIIDSISEDLEAMAVAKAMGIELDEEEKTQSKGLRAQFASANGGYAAYEKYLKKNNSSIEFYNMLGEASIYHTKLDEKIAEEQGDVTVTDEEISKYYNDKYMRAKHILIEKPAEGEEPAEGEKQGEELAKELLERAKSGEDFDALIAEYSTDPGAESNPDGYVFTEGEMVKPFEETVKGLKENEFGICESDYGYHVILRLPLPEMDEERKATAESAAIDAKKDKAFEDLKAKYGISVTISDEIKNVKYEDLSDKMKAIPKTEQQQYGM